MKNNLKERGITLIVLVITIVVLLILAGVSIIILSTRNSILAPEQKELAENILDGENKSGGNTNLPTTPDTTPFLPEGATVTNKDLKTGVTIRDVNGNEWVWIEVPKSIYINTQYNGGTAPTSSEDYEKIESVMEEYVKEYRDSTYKDTWYSEEQHGFESAADYDNHKKSMLKSVYENGGFYIGKYEVGIKEDAYRTYEIKEEEFDIEHPTTGYTPVIQEDKYVYNWVRANQAQELSESLATGERTSSLMFGIQWDLVMKHIETKQGKTQEELNRKSTDWGNYYNAQFEITKGKYSEDYGENFKDIGTDGYTKGRDTILLTTGATTRNATMNIYDLAGNVCEWTLEQYTLSTNGSCTLRGGHYGNYGGDYPASDHAFFSTSYNGATYGFRPALW